MTLYKQRNVNICDSDQCEKRRSKTLWVNDTGTAKSTVHQGGEKDMDTKSQRDGTSQKLRANAVMTKSLNLQQPRAIWTLRSGLQIIAST
jgi:hypothetical protein